MPKNTATQFYLKKKKAAVNLPFLAVKISPKFCENLNGLLSVPLSLDFYSIFIILLSLFYSFLHIMFHKELANSSF